MINDEKFEASLLQKIKEGKLVPKPRWHFLLKDYTVWTVGLVTMVLGAVSVSLMIYISPLGEIGIFNRARGEAIEKALIAIPFFWIVCLSAFIALVYFNIKHTKKGYRYSALSILALAVIASAVFGFAFYAAGFSRLIDDSLGRHMPYYDRMANPGIRFWSSPEQGRLTGLVTDRAEDMSYVVIDFNNEEWKVITVCNECGMRKIEMGRPARFLGEISGEYEFEATEILPMGPGRGFLEDRMRRGEGRRRMMMEMMEAGN